jgi:hypothetical protein
MNSVFVVQHVRPGVGENSNKEVKFIGVYQTMHAARLGVERLKALPGFRDFPDVYDAKVDYDLRGFCIDEYALDQDHWAEGFGT